MGTKSTRSNTEMKAIVAEICSNKDFLKSIFNYVEQCNSEINQNQLDSILETVNINANLIDELRKENQTLKSTIEDMKFEISSLKLQSQQSRERKKQEKEKGKKAVDKHSSRPISPFSEDTVGEPSTAIVTNDSIVNTALLKINERSDPTDNNFVLPGKHKRRITAKTIGDAKIDRSGGVLVGAAHQKTAWFYVGKIANKDAKEEDLHKYITEEEGNIKMTVEKLHSKGLYAAFKVGVPFELLDKLNNPGYWPTGVVVRRFNFWGQGINNQRNKNTFLGRKDQTKERQTHQ